ncbi:MAG: hypothetical protein KDB07_10765, partial [Planctomycetes bacterium]|nr:hypothetical protein [Planctomycetota bacterium]
KLKRSVWLIVEELGLDRDESFEWLATDQENVGKQNSPNGHRNITKDGAPTTAVREDEEIRMLEEDYAMGLL